MSLCCRNCGESLRRASRGILVHDRQQSVFCGDRSGHPLPHPTTTAQTDDPLALELTAPKTYRPRRHRVVKRAA